VFCIQYKVKVDSTRHLGKVFVTQRGEPCQLWPAADQHGAELDILLLKLRDKAASKRCLKRGSVAVRKSGKVGRERTGMLISALPTCRA